MNKQLKMKVVAAMLAGSALFSGSASAMSGTDIATPFSVANTVNFQIVVPGFLYFQVGAVAAIPNTLLFTVPALNVGNSTAVAATGGDAAPSALNVVARANNGLVTIATTVAAATGLGTGTATDGFINYNQITTTSNDVPNFPAPVLANAAIPNTTVALGGGPVGAGKVTNRAAVWTYSYLNTTVPSAGTYTGSVTYTATTP
jgi:hypothetical protein